MVSKAKYIGAKYGTYLAFSGLLLAQLLLLLFFGLEEGFFWIAEQEFLVNFAVGILTFIISGYFLGQIAGFQILIQKRDGEKIGALLGLSILVICSFLGSVIGLIQNRKLSLDAFEDYIFKPMFWLLLVGVIPAIIFGIICGSLIRKKRTEFL